MISVTVMLGYLFWGICGFGALFFGLSYFVGSLYEGNMKAAAHQKDMEKWAKEYFGKEGARRWLTNWDKLEEFKAFHEAELTVNMHCHWNTGTNLTDYLSRCDFGQRRAINKAIRVRDALKAVMGRRQMKEPRAYEALDASGTGMITGVEDGRDGYSYGWVNQPNSADWKAAGFWDQGMAMELADKEKAAADAIAAEARKSPLQKAKEKAKEDNLVVCRKIRRRYHIRRGCKMGLPGDEKGEKEFPGQWELDKGKPDFMLGTYCVDDSNDPQRSVIRPPAPPR